MRDLSKQVFFHLCLKFIELDQTVTKEKQIKQRNFSHVVHSLITAKGLCTCIHSPSKHLQSRLVHNTEERSVCYTVGLCWQSTLNIAVYFK